MRVIIEVKEEEFFWYNKTGNIGLDYLSAFGFLPESSFRKGQWIRKENLSNFLNEIEIYRKGKLFLCDADIQLFYCEDNGEIKLLKAYNNKCLKDKRGIFENEYDLRVNNKNAYDRSVSSDSWESAAYFIKPYNRHLKACEINSWSELKDSTR